MRRRGWCHGREELRFRPSVATAVEATHFEYVARAAWEARGPNGLGPAPGAHGGGARPGLGVVRLVFETACAGVLGVEPVAARGDREADGGEVRVRGDVGGPREGRGREQGEE